MAELHVLQHDAALRDPAMAALVDDLIVTSGDQVYPLRPSLNRIVTWCRLKHHISRNGPFDTVHAWGLDTGVTATGTAPRVIIHATSRVLPGKTTRRIVRRVNEGCATLHTINQAIADDLIACGIDTRYITVEPPSLNTERLAQIDRSELRQRWQIDNDTMLVTAIGDPWLNVDVMLATWIVGLAATTGRKLRLVAHPKMRNIHRAQRLLNSMNRPEQLILDPSAAAPWHILPTCDIALVLDHRANYGGCDVRLDMPPQPGLAGGLSTRWTLAADCAVVAEQSAAVDELITHEANGLVFPAGSTRDAAQMLCEVYDGRQS